MQGIIFIGNDIKMFENHFSIFRIFHGWFYYDTRANNDVRFLAIRSVQK